MEASGWNDLIWKQFAGKNLKTKKAAVKSTPSDAAPLKKSNAGRKKRKPMGPAEVEVVLADLVMPKRMASLNASAILAASSQQWTSERRRRRRDAHSSASDDEDSTTSGLFGLFHPY